MALITVLEFKDYTSGFGVTLSDTGNNPLHPWVTHYTNANGPDPESKYVGHYWTTWFVAVVDFNDRVRLEISREYGKELQDHPVV
jgi:hypothetical protein